MKSYIEILVVIVPLLLIASCHHKSQWSDIPPPSKENVPKYIEALESGSVGHRFIALMNLRNTEADVGELAPYVAKYLAGEDRTNRDIAREILANHPPWVPALLDALDDPDWEMRRAALKGLAEFPKEAEEFLDKAIPLLGDEHPEVCSAAAHVIGVAGPLAKEAVPRLVQMLDSPDIKVQKSACFALGQIGPDAKDAVPRLTEFLRQNDIRTLYSAIEALAGIGPDAAPAAEYLLGYLNDNRPGFEKPIAPKGVPMAFADPPKISDAAANALGRSGPKAVPQLIQALKNNDAYIKRLAARALGNIGPNAEEAVPELINNIDNEDRVVRSVVVGALGQIGKPTNKVVPALIKALMDEYDYVRSISLGYLREIDPTDDLAINGLIGIMGKDESWWRDWTADAFAKIGSKAVPELIKALGSADPSVRLTAAESLGKIGPGASVGVPALIKALEDPDDKVVRGAIVALGNIGAEAAPALPLLDQMQTEEKKHKYEADAYAAMKKIVNSMKETKGVQK